MKEAGVYSQIYDAKRLVVMKVDNVMQFATYKKSFNISQQDRARNICILPTHTALNFSNKAVPSKYISTSTSRDDVFSVVFCSVS